MGLQEAGEKLNKLKMSKAELEAYDKFLMVRQSIDSMMWAAEMKGRVESEAKGEAKGEVKGRVKERQNMLELINKGYSLDEIKAIFEKEKLSSTIP